MTNDKDYYRVRVDGGDVVTLNISHPGGTSTSGQGIRVELLDAAAATVQTALFNGNGSLTTQVLAGGDYFIAVSSQAPMAGTYTLKLQSSNVFADIVQGDAGDNVLDGGIGADTMTGGKGSDT